MASLTHQVEGEVAAAKSDLERNAIRLTAWRVLPLLILCFSSPISIASI